MLRRRWDGVGTARPYVPPVFVAFVLRVLPDELASGRVVGEVEVVETGEHIVIRSVEELCAVMQGCVPTPIGGVAGANPVEGGEADVLPM